ncbi:uncharacterized protein AB675_8486 [Cyphellophora attinorum]|uniref:Uncharacterized protein n=1 Tax=Cyphellophora attinorum TaxID=1664694 RepID=A0A0N1HWR4_9EURO|nr:uncharacterized protein AB675_8486 [Phialophora attinorum]KPI44743.1 hypothetical protein AB675_8486 [Phialophora attinorum]
MVRAIPAEIVEIFLKHVIHGNGERGTSIVNLLCVSAIWRDIGLRLLWSDIVVDCDKLARFVQAPASSNFGLITSLTFTSEPPKETNDEQIPSIGSLFAGVSYRSPDVNKSCRQLNSTLKDLATILPLMTKMKTFSFYIQIQDGQLRAHSTAISRHTLAVVVKSLPESLESLEIDTKCYDRALDGETGEHLCHTIAQRIPSLINLRLRLAVMCPEIIAASKTLRSCVICLGAGRGPFSVTIRCDDKNQGIPISGNESDTRKFWHDLITSMSTKLLPSRNLKKLVVVDATGSSGMQLGKFDIRDLLTSKTTSCPVQTLRYLNILVRYPQGADPSNICDVAGFMGDVEELVEGQSWHTTTTGSRFPDDYKTSSMGAKHDWATNRKHATPESWPAKITENAGDPSFADHSKYWTALHGGPSTLWEDEAKAGRRLVEVRVVDGVGDTEPIIRLNQKEKDNSVVLEQQAQQQAWSAPSTSGLFGFASSSTSTGG